MDKDRVKIFCIEDDVEMIELLKLVLERRGFQFLSAENGPDGLAGIRAEQPDLILLDLMMAEMDGWEVYRQLKMDEGMRRIPVMVVTAKAQAVDRVLGLHIAKVDDYVTKPFSPIDLVGRIERLLESRGGAAETNGNTS
ncbi:MAG TPA: response regulator [Anaerolineales bacterium]|nr:response regulator [Anaerolineales bacterium]